MLDALRYLFPEQLKPSRLLNEREKAILDESEHFFEHYCYALEKEHKQSILGNQKLVRGVE